MKPLAHPALESISLEGILHALSDPDRAAIFLGVAAAGQAQNCTTYQCVAARPIPKSTLSQHFRILREAGLIRSERVGVELRNVSRCAEIEQRFPGLIPAILNAHAIQQREEGQGHRSTGPAAAS